MIRATVTTAWLKGDTFWRPSYYAIARSPLSHADPRRLVYAGIIDSSIVMLVLVANHNQDTYQVQGIP